MLWRDGTTEARRTQRGGQFVGSRTHCFCVGELCGLVDFCPLISWFNYVRSLDTPHH